MFSFAKQLGLLSATFGMLVPRHSVALIRHQTPLPAGITRQEIHLDEAHRIWIYRPKKMTGNHSLVLIAPAGSPLVYGMSLAKGDEPEFIPYAQAGCIVVAYDVSGPYVEGAKNLLDAIRKFKDSQMGIHDAKRALDYALKSIPGVDPHRVIAVGHSSAATLALQVTEVDIRIAACVAYAPVVDIQTRLQSEASNIERYVPGFTRSIGQLTPSRYAERIHRPLFLFHANDDKNVPAEPIRKLAAMVPKAKLFEVAIGGHYDSMLHQGIPAAVAWMRAHGLLDR